MTTSTPLISSLLEAFQKDHKYSDAVFRSFASYSKAIRELEAAGYINNTDTYMSAAEERALTRAGKYFTTTEAGETAITMKITDEQRELLKSKGIVTV